MAKPFKEFEAYLVDPTDAQVSHEDYFYSPGTAFLGYTLEARDALNHCTKHFKTKIDGNFTKAASESLEHLGTSLLPTIMGHFETFQKCLFAGSFDKSIYLKDFDVDAVCRKLGGQKDLSIDPSRLAAHRLSGVTSIGMLLADSLGGWHSPDAVNQHFKNLYMKPQLFSNDDIERINVLWQLRHSIVHTGGTLTAADAQKVKRLRNVGARNIAFSSGFISEVSRKFHAIIFQCVQRAKKDFFTRTKLDLEPAEIKQLNAFFKVDSKTKVWLPE